MHFDNSAEKLEKKRPDLKYWMKTVFLEIFNSFFWIFRHNRHFFRQNGRKFFIVEKLSFKLWSQFCTGAPPERKLCTSMWELWRNDRFLTFFTNFDASYLHNYDELVESFLHVYSAQLICFTQKFSAKCVRLLMEVAQKNCKLLPEIGIIPS